MEEKPPFLRLPLELRRNIYRGVAMDIKTIVVTAIGILPPPLAQVSEQIKSEFISILDEVHPGYSSGTVVPRKINKVIFNIKGFSPASYYKKQRELMAGSRGHKFDLVFVDI